ncbi:GDPD1 Lysophospholipase, partial [Lophotis ruficrista]|nr:GDPD1 Lysophospholipase [Lophotis ruficrista]
ARMSATLYLLSTLGGYVLTSVLLLKCPGLLHRPKRQRFRCRHISHRGGECGAGGWWCAVNIGTDMLELIYIYIFFEQVVVSHDENLKYIYIYFFYISDLKYSELPPYLCKLDVTFQKECQCEGIYIYIFFLKEVFEAFPQTPVIYIYIFFNNVLIKKVSELVSQYKREHLTVWGNVIYIYIFFCVKENVYIYIFFFSQRVLLLLGLFYTGLLPFVPFKEEFLEIPMPYIYI